MSHIFPRYILNENKLYDGILYKAHPFCVIHSNDIICKKFYNSLAIDNFSICPYGYAVYYSKDNPNYIICSLKINGFYNKRKVSKRSPSEFSPVMNTDIFENYIRNSFDLNKGLTSFKDALHDVRKLNTDIKYSAEKLLQIVHDYASIEEARRILAQSGLLTTNLDIFDLEVNPDLLGIGRPQSVHIYKLFDKTLKILKYNFNKKNIEQNIVGRSDTKIKLPKLFVTVPFIILENAAKYTENNGKVIIFFEESDTSLHTYIECNDSPQVLESEKEKVFNNGYRGQHLVENYHIKGQGKGLYFLKQVCDKAGINYYIESGPYQGKSYNNMPYCKFQIHLIFNKI